MSANQSTPSAHDRFLAALFRQRDPASEKVVLSNAHLYVPQGKTAEELAFKPYDWVPGAPARPWGWHFNCTTLMCEAKRARHDAAYATHVVMLDDLGNLPGKSKASLERLLALSIKPHAVLQTRRDREGRTNNQAFFLVKPCPTASARILVKAAADAGWCDPDCTGGLRWARLPGSIKHDDLEGFPAELVLDNLGAPGSRSTISRPCSTSKRAAPS
jgi:hypothetical protein